VTEAAREAAREEVRSQSGNPGLTASPDLVRQRLEQKGLADVSARSAMLTADTKARIGRAGSVPDPAPADRVHRLDRTARAIRDPAFFPRLFDGPDLAARVTTDEFDAEQVVVMRLVE